MNKPQRKRLNKAIELIEKAQAIIEEIREEEEDKYYELPENLQYTEANQAIEAGAETLNEIHAGIEEYKDQLAELING